MEEELERTADLTRIRIKYELELAQGDLDSLKQEIEDANNAMQTDENKMKELNNQLESKRKMERLFSEFRPLLTSIKDFQRQIQQTDISIAEMRERHEDSEIVWALQGLKQNTTVLAKEVGDLERQYTDQKTAHEQILETFSTTQKKRITNETKLLNEENKAFQQQLQSFKQQKFAL